MNLSPRQLRGVVLHVIRPAREHGHSRMGRIPAGGLWYRSKDERAARKCVWCHRPHGRDGRAGYHRDCKRVKNLFTLSAGWGSFLRRYGRCGKCGKVQRCEIDHRVAISIATEVCGVDGWVRALLPGNLQRLCRTCHKAKTAEDARTLAALYRIARGEQLRELERPFRDPAQTGLEL